jgi:serine/threonine-protein kinase
MSARAASTPPSKPERIAAGTVIDKKYYVVGLIGRGGYSIVYEAIHTKLGQKVALKFLEKEPDRKALDRFEQEARLAATFAHPNVCRSYDLGMLPSGTRYIVMERLHGETLYELLSRERRLEPSFVVHIGSQVLAALEVAHAASVIHRDIKPGNVFVEVAQGVEPTAKVLDFGLAKIFEGSSSIRTTIGRALGTPAYMSPEQITGKPLDGRSDLFAVGIVLFEALVGKRPWSGRSTPDLCASILRDPTPPVDVLRPNISPELAAIVRRALEKDPRARFRSAAAFRQALQGLRAPSPHAPAAPSQLGVRLPSLHSSSEDDSHRS